ncbi:hypothetical protein TEA_002187 [Camellia sinensis var. sinensis]|uniref:ABC transmembrane type-1 domain-containing protein n=1 Tax=Camellia sinensis var. sinensis TaxID=542762 RepID=A0A4S4DBK6_CAMSN|nr:hypothetical protein TEA_002187 [Camellia sinensis var. sinensis]
MSSPHSLSLSRTHQTPLSMSHFEPKMSVQSPLSGDGEAENNVKTREGEGKKPKKVPLMKLFAFANAFDYFLMLVGSIGACIHGASVPVFFIFFGKLINIIGMAYLFPAAASHRVAKYSMDFVYLSVVILFSSWTGERQAAKMRMEYLRSMLNQDISAFDTDASSTGEVISAITSDIIVVQDAISEKDRVTTLILVLSLLPALVLTCSDLSEFNVLDYGAVGDGMANDTLAFVEAWNKTCNAESEDASMVVPEGMTFLVYPMAFVGPCNPTYITFLVEEFEFCDNF